MNTKYHDGVDLLGVTTGWDKLTAAGVGEIGFAEVGVDSDSITQDDIKPAF